MFCPLYLIKEVDNTRWVEGLSLLTGSFRLSLSLSSLSLTSFVAVSVFFVVIVFF
jgi:hypothetical protein